MDRRDFLGATAATLALAATTAARAQAVEGSAPAVPTFATADAEWQAAYDKALAVLAANVRIMPYISRPVLIEGSVYQGIWQECGPHEALVYRKFAPKVARDSHLTFFELQRIDGQLPANNKIAETGFGQIQMVVPIAATAWELAKATGDEELTARAYDACGRWDDWLMRYRNTRGTGLVEAFCTYDTGMDNSERFRGVPSQCPNKDAKRHADLPILPFLAPDLSATIYGARRAMVEMAKALGKADEAARWEEKAASLRATIIEKLWVAEDGAFYDIYATGEHNKVRGDILTRMCGEHLPDKAMFETMWTKQLGNPKAFWTAFPFPSVAVDDPLFVASIPDNSWGGATQALTALRTSRWMDHYGRSAEHGVLMDAWTRALLRDPSYRQQMNPFTGAFTQSGAPDYSPAALVMMDHTWRLAGVVEEDGLLHWNVRPGHRAARGARFTLPLDRGGTAELRYDGRGAELSLSGKAVARIEGGAARLTTDLAGKPLHATGIDGRAQRVALRRPGAGTRSLRLPPNARVAL